MNRISRLFTTAAGVAIAGRRARITGIGGNEPMPYAFTDGGALIHDGNCWTSPTGEISVYVVSDVGARFTVFQLDGSILFQQDIGIAEKAGTTVVSDPANTAVAPAELTVTELLVNSSFTAFEGDEITPNLFLVYSDGTYSDSLPFADGVLTVESDDEAVATVEDTLGTITAVATGGANITYTFTPTVGTPVTAVVGISVTGLGPTELSAQAEFLDLIDGNDYTVSLFLSYNNGNVVDALPFANGVLTAVPTNPAVATVDDSTGVVTAVAPGTTTITWTFTPTSGTPLVTTTQVTVIAAA